MSFLKNLNQHKHPLLLVGVTLFLIFLPFFSLFSNKDFKWQDVDVKTVAISVQRQWANYYDARIKEIMDGYPLIGNPYFLEHNNEITPAFFVTDWLAAIPRFLGASLYWGAIINMLFWSLVFVFLAYGILREMGVSKTFSVVGAELSYFHVYYMMNRAVSMQIVFPFYLFFLLAFLFWAKDHTNKKRKALLILASTLTFYIYTYLWQISFIMLGLAGLYWLIIGEKERVMGLIKILGYTIIFSAPVFVFAYLQIAHPYYWETMQRIGFVSTHMPFPETFYKGRLIILIILAWLLSFIWSKELRANQPYKISFIFMAISGLSLIIASASNIITGKEMELAEHVGRFVFLWTPLALVAFLFFIKSNWMVFKSFGIAKKFIVLILCLMYLYGLRASYSGFYLRIVDGRPEIQQTAAEDRQSSAVLGWLENREKKPVVVWIGSGPDSVIQRTLVAATRHYVLYAIPGGQAHLMSSQEVEERYLVSNYFNHLTLDDIKKDSSLYAGAAVAGYLAKVKNRKVKLCNFFRLNLLGYDCGRETNSYELKGEKYFTDLYDKYTKEIAPNIEYYLKKYHVTYFIKDRRDINAIKPWMERVYYDDYYEIYKIKYGV